MSPEVDDIKHLKELIFQRFELLQLALDLQSKEMARRLELLNGEADRFLKMEITYLPREVYEQHHNEITKNLQSLDRRIVWFSGGIAVIVFIITTFSSLLLRKMGL